MERVSGIGGIFIRAGDPAALMDWYGTHLGIEPDFDSGAVFRWRESAEPDHEGSTTWALFPEDSTYFGPTTARFMVNYRVHDLDAMLAQLRRMGVPVDDHVEQHEYGRFGWAFDLEGNRFELWEPAPGQ